ncbi:MAG: hypothetical protein ABIJ97_14275 [Bacteroidota bacterium]
MRAPKRKRPLINKLIENFDKDELRKISSMVRYIGSPEHKNSPNKITGFSKPRADASICPQDISNKPATVLKWLKKAFTVGCIGELWEGKFPRYIWYYDSKSETAFMGRLVNKEKGEYKGWPIEKWEWPAGIAKYYE